MDLPNVGETVVHLAAHCDGEADLQSVVLSIHLGLGYARIQGTLGSARMVPLHELQVVGISEHPRRHLDDYREYI